MSIENRDVVPEDLDPAVLESTVGRQYDQGAEPGGLSADDIVKPIGAARRSDETDGHVAGADDEETEDGLDPTEEALRRAAEDLEPKRDLESLPVFDRGDTLPRV